MSLRDHSLEAAATVAKAAPSLGVSGLLVFGYPVADVVVAITGVYTLVLLSHLLWKWRREWKEKR